jgi:carboxypeptidase T
MPEFTGYDVFMKNLKGLLSVLVFVALGMSQLGMKETGSKHILVRLSLQANYLKQMAQIQKLGLDVAGVDLTAKTVDLIVSQAEADQLNTLGFHRVQTRAMVSLASPDADYQTPAKIENTLKNIAAAYPNLSQVMSVGKSLEGRDIFAMKITANVTQNNPAKPHIFFNGMHHAREVMSTEVPLDTINTLLSQYGHDPKVTHWVDTFEIWILPMFNVDGNNKVWTEDNMWRKNARGGYGVDINRNYPYAWNSCRGSSNSQSAQDYHGPSAASEVETHVMMDLIKKIRPVFSISYHSYNEIVIYPYGCEGQRTPTQEVVEGIGKELAALIVTDNGRSHYKPGVAPDLLYSVDGGDIDWMYHEYQVIPYVIEVNSSAQGFQPDYKKWRDSTVNRVKPAWQYLLSRLDGSSLHGQIKDISGNAVAKATVHVERTGGGTAFIQDYPVQENGYFMVVVPAGDYRVSYLAPGFQTSTQSYHVGATRLEVSANLSR